MNLKSFTKNYLTNPFNLCIIIIGNGENHKRGLPQIKWFKTHLTRESFTDVFLLVICSYEVVVQVLLSK